MNLITLMLSIMLVLLSTFISSNLPTSLGYERFLPLFAALFFGALLLAVGAPFSDTLPLAVGVQISVSSLFDDVSIFRLTRSG